MKRNLTFVLLCAAPLLGLRSGAARSQTPDSAYRLPALSPSASVIHLNDLIRLSLEQNPALRQAELEINAAQGRSIQAGLYPNPTVSFVGEEIGKNGGIHTLPQVSQEIVTGGKRRLSRAIGAREVDQASLGLLRQRFWLLTAVRQGYFDVLAAQQRVAVLGELVNLVGQAAENAEKLFKAKQIAEIDVVPFRVEVGRLRADLEATQREQEAAWRWLAATAGVPHLALATVAGSLETVLPPYDFDEARAIVVQEHPETAVARVGITRAELTLQRARVERVPNVTLVAGYSRNFNDRENQATYQVGIPVPVFNRNQGNILAAQAELGRAMYELSRVQNELSSRLATAFGQYAAARQRAQRYESSVLPDADKALRMSMAAFKGGQFEYLRVIQAQRTLAEARLEYLRARAGAWRAAAEIAGLLLEEDWPRSVANGKGRK